MSRSRWTIPLLALALAACSTPLQTPLAEPPGEAPVPYHVQAVAPLAVTSVAVDSTSAGSAAAIVDGNLSTQWVNGGYKNATAWASVGFSSAYTLTSVAIKTGPSPAGTSYDIQVSPDGASWTTKLAGQTNTTWNMETKTLPAGTGGKYVRILWHNSATSPQAHFAIFELQVSGSSGTTSSPTPAPTPTPGSSPTPTPTPTSSTGGLYPSASVAAAAYASHQSFLGYGLKGPNGLARDGYDNLYESDWNGNTVTKVAQSGTSTLYAGGFNGPAGLAFDKSGNLLVAEYNRNTLDKVPPGGGSHTIFIGSGLNRPVWPAVNSQGIIYLADYSNNRIAKITPTGQVSTFKSISGVNAIDIDNQDNLWICTWGGTVAKITPTGTMTTLTTGLWTACAIAWCPNYVAVGLYGSQTSSTGKLLLVDTAGKSYSVATGLNRTSSVIFDSKGSLYAANIGDTALRKYALK